MNKAPILIGLLALAATPNLAHAAGAPTLSPFMVAVSVKDLEAETAWYVRTFGATVERNADMGNGRTLFRWLKIGNQRLELVYSATAADASPARAKPPGHANLHGFTHFTMETGDIAATKADLIARGATLLLDISDVPGLGIKVMYVADPEGNAVEIAQKL